MFGSLFLFLGGLIAAALLVHAAGFRLGDSAHARAIVLLAIFLVLTAAVVREIRANNAKSTNHRFSFERLLNKSLALATGWLLVFAAAALGSSLNLAPSIVFLEDLLPLSASLPLLIPAYVLFCERFTADPEDAHASFGAFLRRKGAWTKDPHATLSLGWLVKAFFLPLMYGNLVIAIDQLLATGITRNPGTWVVWFAAFGLSVDLLVATIGYVGTGKLFGAEIRSVDDSWIGWAVCLLCYAPFFQYVKLVTEQRDALTWTDWLKPDEPLYWAWATLLVSSWGVYWLSSIAFGLKFSNLTYRGLVDRGPYKYLKHPAYLSKNIYWWLHTVPFVGVASAGDLAANLAGLSAVSLIYYLRAKTEERHLMRFPEYAEYARRIEQRSVRAKLQQWSGWFSRESM